MSNPIKVGDTLFVKYDKDQRYQPQELVESTVVRVGPKWVTLRQSGCSHTAGDIRYDVNTLRPEPDKCGGVVYRTRQAYADAVEWDATVRVIHRAFDQFSPKFAKFTLDQLRRIKSIMDEPASQSISDLKRCLIVDLESLEKQLK